MAAGDIRQFKVALGDSGKPVHLKVEYLVSRGGLETIAFGFKPIAGGAIIYPFSCFIDKPPNVIGSKTFGCPSNSIEFSFFQNN